MVDLFLCGFLSVDVCHLYVTAGLGRQTPGEGKQPDPAYKQDPQSGRDNVTATQQLPATSACCQMIDIFFVIACIHVLNVTIKIFTTSIIVI